VGCEVNKIEEEPDLLHLVSQIQAAPKGEGVQLKFDAWVDTCIREGFWRNVSGFEHDVVAAYQEYQEQRAELSRSKGKGRPQDDISLSQSNKRKISPSKEKSVVDLGSSPIKKRKLENGATSTR
jgi:hypothetical protein